VAYLGSNPTAAIRHEADRAPLAIRRTWARLIRKIYEVDPLLCSGCGTTMKVIAVIEQEEVIYRSAELATKPDPGSPRVPRGWLQGMDRGPRPGMPVPGS
jgi:hypothetical protein